MALTSAGLRDDLISASADIQLRGGYSGSVVLTNETGQYGSDLEYEPISFSIAATSSNGNFSGTASWINGIIHAVEDNREVVDANVVLTVKSYFDSLKVKPICSETFTGDAMAALTKLAVEYAGVDAALVNFGSGGTLDTPIQGTSMLEEMYRICQAAEKTLFVNKTGTLTAESWQGVGSTSIPDSAIISTRLSSDTAIGPSVITVRGAYTSAIDEGPVPLSSNGTGSSPKNGGGRGRVGKCVFMGNSNAQADINVPAKEGADPNGLDAGEALLNGTGVQVGAKSENADGNPGLQIEGDAGEAIPRNPDPKNPIVVEAAILGVRRPEDEAKDASVQNPNLGKNEDWLQKKIDQMIKITAGEPVKGGPAGGGGLAGGSGSNRSSTANAADKEPNRLQVIVEDQDLIDLYGIRHEEIDNPYVTDEGTLYNIGLRRLQEHKWQKHVYNVELVYQPGLDVNQIVSFTTPDTLVNVSGIVSAVRLTYSAEGTVARQSISVDAFAGSIGTGDNSETVIEPSLPSAQMPTEEQSLLVSDKRVRGTSPNNFILDSRLDSIQAYTPGTDFTRDPKKAWLATVPTVDAGTRKTIMILDSEETGSLSQEISCQAGDIIEFSVAAKEHDVIEALMTHQDIKLVVELLEGGRVVGREEVSGGTATCSGQVSSDGVMVMIHVTNLGDEDMNIQINSPKLNISRNSP